MNISFTSEAFEEYRRIAQSDRKAFKKINALIDSILREGLLKGIGKPERLKHIDNMFSRHINHGDRLVYTGDKQGNLIITSCIGHYEE